MQIRMEAIKNKAKFLSFNSFRASSPSISEILTLVPGATLGGVFGRVKLKIPKINEAIEAIKKVFRNKPPFTADCASHKKTKLIASPATIQPMVPQTLILENSFSGSLIWLNEIEFTKASVGIYKIIYASTKG